MNRAYIFIPAYQPDMGVVRLVQSLLDAGMTDILIVDDGSGPDYAAIFAALPKTVIILRHEINQGKGAAIKTGLAYLRDHNITASLITVDADGQHLPEDVHKIYEASLANPRQFILGVRTFDRRVPLRSRFGNELSRYLFRLLYQYPIQDTQTGLRAIPSSLQTKFLDIEFNRYEFESECLIQAVKSGVVIKQIPIQTVYLNHNASSHFNPLVDSVKIYYVFFRYCLISLASFALDFAIFASFEAFTHNIFLSLIIARIFSGGFNFYQNKYRVYCCHKRSHLGKQFLQYAILAAIIFSLGYTSIMVLVGFHWNVLLAKVLVDAILFSANFIIQKTLIFRPRKE